MSLTNKHKTHGQSMVELAIALPVLMIILGGLLDLGRIYITLIALEEATAEGALYLAISPHCLFDSPISDGGTGICSSPNNATYRAASSGNQEFDTEKARFNIDELYIHTAGYKQVFPNCTIAGVSVADIGCLIVVTVDYDYELVTPLITPIVRAVTGQDTIPLHIQSTQVVICSNPDYCRGN